MLECRAIDTATEGTAPSNPDRTTNLKRLCVSACLLGIPCRWKGDAKPCEAVRRLAERAVVCALDPATRSALEKHHAESAEGAELASHAESAENAEVELVPFCPELAAGLGCPRPPIELVEGEGAEPLRPFNPSTVQPSGARVRALRVDRTGDATDALRAACEAEAEALARAGGVDGFVLKSRSPSCGLASPLHDAAGREIGTAPGLWAAIARERFPDADLRDETQA